MTALGKGYDEYATKAKGLLSQMSSFETYFSLKLATWYFYRQNSHLSIYKQ